MTIQALAAKSTGQPLSPYSYTPDDLGPYDVELEITHCGLCHSDIHLIDNDWQTSSYPLVPGHEIIGTIRARGAMVSHLTEGLRVGVGWQCGSCLSCHWCLHGEEQLCPDNQATCVGRPGGFADRIRVDSRFTYPIPEKLASERAAPLLCAGITVYAPLRRWLNPGMTMGVIGIGGLGHLALQFARAFGCEVTAISNTATKEGEARRFGAHHFLDGSEPDAIRQAAGRFDFLLSTVPADLDWEQYLQLLRPKGTLCLVGAAPGMMTLSPTTLLMSEKTITGSVIGSRSTMQEMLTFAARQDIAAQIEVMAMADANSAIQRVRDNQARYRIVLTNG